MVEFSPREKSQGKILALVYLATSDNPIYLGPATPSEIAAQIATSRGNTGHNIEYLLRLADFMRLCCPEVEDDHLFSIEAAALALLLSAEEANLLWRQAGHLLWRQDTCCDVRTPAVTSGWTPAVTSGWTPAVTSGWTLLAAGRHCSRQSHHINNTTVKTAWDAPLLNRVDVVRAFFVWMIVVINACEIDRWVCRLHAESAMITDVQFI